MESVTRTENNKVQLQVLWVSFTHRIVPTDHGIIEGIASHLDSLTSSHERRKKVKFAVCCKTFADYYAQRSRGHHKEYSSTNLIDFTVGGRVTGSQLVAYLAEHGLATEKHVLVPGYGLCCQQYLTPVVKDPVEPQATSSQAPMPDELPAEADPTKPRDTNSQAKEMKESAYLRALALRKARRKPMTKEDHINFAFINSKEKVDKAVKQMKIVELTKRSELSKKLTF